MSKFLIKAAVILDLPESPWRLITSAKTSMFSTGQSAWEKSRTANKKENSREIRKNYSRRGMFTRFFMSQRGIDGFCFIAAGDQLWYSASGFSWHMARKKETLQVLELGAVPDDGVQALPAGSEKPEVVIMATHLNKHGFLFPLRRHETFFCIRTPARTLGRVFLEPFKPSD